MTEIDLRPWHYFLTLERDFAATAEFVEPHASNMVAFSDRYAGLLLLIGSEIDVLAKALARKISPEAAIWNMGDCCPIITEKFPALCTVEIDIPRYSLSSKPWITWGSDPKERPSWWDDYNAIKHDRLSSRHRASQVSVIDSLSGLFVINLYYYENIGLLSPHPQILDYGFPAYYTSEPSKLLLGFESPLY